ncbi:MAG: nucleoside hydrolase [Alistipes sp.]|nr:nucleoside hydrolase [Alistipes sp.]
MKRLFCLLGISLFLSCAPTQHPVSILFDTDMAPDYDDVGALTLLHALADSGEARILGTITSNRQETSAPCIDVINTYFGRPDLPVGGLHGPGVTMDTWHHGNGKPDESEVRWTHALPARFPHKIASTAEAQDAVQLYRSILQAQPDTSVVVITVGFFTNLRDLLASAPDSLSPLSGRELVAQKVKRLVSMAGAIPQGKEFNILMDAPAAQAVIEQWPTPILFSGFDIGVEILTGASVAAMDAPESPVTATYRMCLEQDNPAGRMSWDQTAVLAAVRGADPYFATESGRMSVNANDSTNRWTPDPQGSHVRLLPKMPLPELTATIEALMCHQPVAQRSHK